jgi:hypothetical protein
MRSIDLATDGVVANPRQLPLVTLVGTLGRLQELRDANPFAVEVDAWNTTPRVEFLAHDTGGRPFAIFAVARRGERGKSPARPWTRCLLPRADRPEHRVLYQARPGDLVALTGRWGTYTTYLEETGGIFTFAQFVVEDLRLLAPGERGSGEPVLLDRRQGAAA